MFLHGHILPLAVEQEELVSTCEGNANGSHCSFPFIYNGVKYVDCTVVNSFDNWRPWCVTNQSRSDEYNKWGYCDCEENNTVSLKATCELYSGSPVCETYLNGTVVFTDNQYSQRDLAILMDHFNKSFYDSQQNSRCVGPSLQALCHLLFPECQKSRSLHSNAPLPLCHNSCTALSNGSCGPEFIQMMQRVTSYFQSYSLNPVHFFSGQSLCSRLPHKDKFIDNCADIDIDVSSPNKANPGSASGSDKVVIISVSVPVGCIGLITLCIVVLIWKRRKTEKITFLQQSEILVDMTETGQVKMEIEWDADIAYAILETLVNGKRINLAEQIGEGRT